MRFGLTEIGPQMHQVLDKPEQGMTMGGMAP